MLFMRCNAIIPYICRGLRRSQSVSPSMTPFVFWLMFRMVLMLCKSLGEGLVKHQRAMTCVVPVALAGCRTSKGQAPSWGRDIRVQWLSQTRRNIPALGGWGWWTWQLELTAETLLPTISTRTPEEAEGWVLPSLFPSSSLSITQKEFVLGVESTEMNKTCLLWHFPGSPVAKTPHSHCRGPGFDPWSRN